MSTGESKELMREEMQATREKLIMSHEQNQPTPMSLAGESSTGGDEGKQANGKGEEGDPREGKSSNETATTTSVSKSWPDIKHVQIVFDGDHGGDHDGNDGEGDMVISGARLSLLLEMDYVATLLSGRWSTDDGGRDWECLSCGSKCGQDLDECDLCGLSRGWLSDDSAPPPTTDHICPHQAVLHLPCQRGVLEEIFSLHERGTLTEGREPTCEVLAAGKVQIVCMICCWRRTRTCRGVGSPRACHHCVCFVS